MAKEQKIGPKQFVRKLTSGPRGYQDMVRTKVAKIDYDEELEELTLIGRFEERESHGLTASWGDFEVKKLPDSGAADYSLALFYRTPIVLARFSEFQDYIHESYDFFTGMRNYIPEGEEKEVFVALCELLLDTMSKKDQKKVKEWMHEMNMLRGNDVLQSLFLSKEDVVVIPIDQAHGTEDQVARENDQQVVYDVSQLSLSFVIDEERGAGYA